MLAESKIHYRRNILISIIISEAIIIAAFIFSPGHSAADGKILYDEPVILFNDIPQTVQSEKLRNTKPDAPPIYISDEVDAFKLLEDVSLPSLESGQTGMVSAEFADQSNIRPVRSVPRLIFEVIPPEGDNEFNGRLQLSLRIDDKGRVVDHRILYNSLACSDCLNNIIKAAYRSKWEPAKVNGVNSDYWVVKSYIFN